jgi:prophage regulatory protein
MPALRKLGGFFYGETKMVKHKFMDLPQVLDMTRTSRSHLYALVAKKEFPSPIKLGLRSTRWLEAEVQDWMESRIAQSRGRSTEVKGA